MKAKRHSGFALDEVNFDILFNVDAKGGERVTEGWMNQWMVSFYKYLKVARFLSVC